MVQKVMVVDEDGRKTEEEYAAAHMLPLENVQKRFAATGVIKCGSREGTAQLTGDRGVITTVAHMFYREGCEKPLDVKECTFTVKSGDREEVRKMSMVGMGYKCPAKPSPTDDWAVLKLNSKIENVDAYDIPHSGEEIQANDKITAVSVGAVDFIRKNKRGLNTNPKAIEDCEARKVYRRGGIPVYFESTCDSSSGASGSTALSRRGGKDVVVGVLKSAGGESAEAERRAVKMGTPNQGPYTQSEWTTFFVPLDGDFLATVQSAISNRSL